MSKNTPRRALVVIDVQNEYIHGKFWIEYVEVKQSLPNIELTMDFARDEGIPIAVIQHVLDPHAPIFARGPLGVELFPGIASRRRDQLIAKTLPSCFTGTEFGAWVDGLSIDTHGDRGPELRVLNAAEAQHQPLECIQGKPMLTVRGWVFRMCRMLPRRWASAAHPILKVLQCKKPRPVAAVNARLPCV